LSECKKLAEDLRIVVSEENIISESESAKKSGNRLKFNKLLSRIEKGELEGIIAWHPNRFAIYSVSLLRDSSFSSAFSR